MSAWIFRGKDKDKILKLSTGEGSSLTEIESLDAIGFFNCPIGV